MIDDYRTGLHQLENDISAINMAVDDGNLNEADLSLPMNLNK